MPTITPLPTPPSRSDPTNFSARADAFLAAMVTFQQELNALLPAESAGALAVALAGDNSTSTGGALVGHGSLLNYVGRALGRVVNDMGRVLQGADPFGLTDSTVALRAHFDSCIAAGSTIVLPAGTYLVSGPIANPATIAAGALHVRCVGDVTITVAAGAAAFDALIPCATTAINSSSISGGRLTLQLSGRCASGIVLRHAGTDGGTVDWGPLTVLNAKKLAGDTNENGGLVVDGRYLSVTMCAPIIDTIERTAVGGACKGINVSGVSGPVLMVVPQVSRVLCPAGGGDADGISVFGRNISGTYATRGGSLTIISPRIIDCQGRSIKTQISESATYHPIINRQAVRAIATADIDHQAGGVHDIVGPTFTYRKAAGVDPFEPGFYPISLQHQCTDATNRMRVIGGTLRTEAALPVLCYLTVGTSSLAGEVEISDFEVQALAGLTAPISRTMIEFRADHVQASAGVHVSIRGTRGDFSGCSLIGYTDASSANTSKLSFDVQANENTGGDGATGAAGKVFGNLSGTVITQVGGFRLANNAGLYDYLGTWNFNFLALKAGCAFAYDRVSSTVTNGPTMTGAYPRVEVLGSISSGTRDIRIMEDTGSALVIHHRQSATWRTVT